MRFQNWTTTTFVMRAVSIYTALNCGIEGGGGTEPLPSPAPAGGRLDWLRPYTKSNFGGIES